MKILTLKNIEKEVTEGTIGLWTGDTNEYELYFDRDNDFMGVVIEKLKDNDIEQIKSDCENSKGVFSPDFEDTDISRYDIVSYINQKRSC